MFSNVKRKLSKVFSAKLEELENSAILSTQFKLFRYISKSIGNFNLHISEVFGFSIDASIRGIRTHFLCRYLKRNQMSYIKSYQLNNNDHYRKKILF